jgi:hypothetical protein
MSDKLESIFNECLERISQGESIESCLWSYPQEAAQLEPLLRTALGFSWRASAIQPTPEFKARARAGMRYQAAQLGTTQVQQPKHSGSFSWQRGWAVALTAILIFVFSGVGTAAASSNALPDDPLYPVKLATEELKLAFTVSEEKKAEIHAQLAETRATEIATMTSQGKTEQVVATTNRLVQEREKADIAIARVELATTVKTPQPTATTGAASSNATLPTPASAPTTPTPAATTEGDTVKTTQDTDNARKVERLNKAVVTSTSRSLDALKKALEQAPQKSQPALQQAIQTLTDKEVKRLPHKPNTSNRNIEQEQEHNQNQIQNPSQIRNLKTEQDRNTNQKPGQSTSADTTDNKTQSATSQNQTATQELLQQTIKHKLTPNTTAE